uniref:Uncharacterized protein n=1 Tax=Nelumbo nucifera TaxID=4432 RepID=A0A822ZCL3_NELNU|nr:TPA_asm: hypothetical protein HUJ06_000490 [Nelumbo nucifera]
MEWALAELINHPSVFEKAREEVDVVIGKSRSVEEPDIPNLPYLQAIIPAETTAYVNIWAIGRDPKHWDNPLEFQPERFIAQEGSSTGAQLDVRGQHFHFLPFGSGRRSCPGASLALQLMETTLASLIQCFEWKVGDGKDILT